MPFSDIMKEIVNGTEGAVGALIVGLDGIPVEEYSINKEMDIQSMTVEYSALLKEIEKGSQSAQIGSTREVTVIADKAMIMLRRLNDEYFIVLIIKPEGNFGKGRFLLRMSAPKLLKEF
jgi:predicted regulator of Ras-like GTPase activity (Roadblock/LC7/MglB family)